jgi:SulP family sulfate permease
MERVSYMDQSGAYALQDTIVDLKSAGRRVLVVGLPLAPLHIFKALHLVPDVVPEEDLFPNFPALKAALGRVLTAVEGAEVRPA